MEITVRKADLLQELLLLQGAVERKTTIPILAHILAEATPEGRLLLAATDLEVGLETGCAATVKKSGACALPARKLLDYVKLLPEALITLKQLENHWVGLRCARASTKIVGMSRENYPELAAFPPNGALSLPAGPLKSMIAKAGFAVATEESRYTLNGALMVLKPESLTLVATDGHRLAHIVQEGLKLEGVAGEVKALVPKKALGELASMLERAEDDAVIAFAQDDTHLYFRVPSGGSNAEGGQRQLSARKLSGQFPNYEAVLPKTQLKSVPLVREELMSSIARVAQFADERTHAIRMRMEPNKVVLTASSSDMGESEEELEASYEGEPVVIGFNARYLVEFLQVVEEEGVLLEFKDESSAAQLRPAASDGAQYRYVVMPMRI
ncbi:MAG: DNA polymerase III subunit beta [Terriglobales bacterium]